MKLPRKAIASLIATLIISAIAGAQSRHSEIGNEAEGSVLPVFAWRSDKTATPIAVDNLHLYENGHEQKIINFAFDPSPSRIVLLVDNSQTIPPSLDSIKQAAMEFAYEIFEGDQLFTIAYDERAEIIQEWTDDAKKMEASYLTFRKKGNPYLFDALTATVNEVLLPLMPGTRKTAIVIIGDGLDRGSKTTFDKILGTLQSRNITVYALQIPDRTGGAYRRDQPKASGVIEKLTAGTGGLAFDFDDAQAAAKTICDEMKRNRYLLSYVPQNTSAYDARRLLLLGDEGIETRAKIAQPPNIK